MRERDRISVHAVLSPCGKDVGFAEDLRVLERSKRRGKGNIKIVRHGDIFHRRTQDANSSSNSLLISIEVDFVDIDVEGQVAYLPLNWVR